MPLSQDDRIVFSKKMVEAPFTLDALAKSKTSLQTEKEKAEKLDIGHKNLCDGKTFYIDKWQLELTKIDGYPRAVLVEQDFQDGANMVLGNSLFPNDPQNPPPSTAPMVWTKTKPYARNKLVGKFNNEQFGTQIDGEFNTIAAIQADILALETTWQAIELVSGQSCNSGGTCSLPIHLTQATCEANSGVWTPDSMLDVIANNTTIHTALTSLIAKINLLKLILLAEVPLVYNTDIDTGRATQAQANIDDINNVAIPALDAWLAKSDFNTAHGQTTCVGFYAYSAPSLGATKLQAADLTILKNALIARNSFAVTRKGQLDGYLGTVTQNLGDGTATGSGFYYDRWLLVLLRLNMLGGSLFAAKGFERSIQAQDDMIASINAAVTAYNTVLKCSILAAPGNGTVFVQVKDGTVFSAGDKVYLIAEEQEELVRSVKQVVGNRLELGQSVPAKYRPASFARIYKDIS